MRIHFIGNVCNTHYVLAKFLRRLGVDARLYYEPNHPQHCPESEDPELAERMPDWLHPFPRQNALFQPLSFVSKNLLQDLSCCDLIHAQDISLFWAYRTGKPYIWHPYGGDVFHLPFYHWLKDWKLGPYLPDFRNLRTPLLMRRAIAHASAIAIGWHNRLWVRGLKLIRDLGASGKIVRHHIALDTERFVPPPEEKKKLLRRSLLPRSSPEELVVFHPARQAFTSAYPNTRKGNDLLYRALARLSGEGMAFTLVIVKTGTPDDESARRLLEQLGLSGKVVWVEAMPRHELIRWYSAADITADHFIAGAMGAIPLESMACGTPVLMYLQTEPDGEIFMDPRELYPTLPPVINVNSEEAIFQKLLHYVRKKEELSKLGQASRRWTVENVSGEVTARRYLRLYETVLGGAGLRERSIVSPA